MKMTTDEIKVVTFALVALVVGAAAKHYRVAHPEPPRPTPGPSRLTLHPW